MSILATLSQPIMTETALFKLKQDFLIKQVFGNKDVNEGAYINSAINKAYRDFSRTMHGYSMTTNKSLHTELKAIILATVNDFRKYKCNQTEFDDKHSQCCNKLIETFKRKYSSNTLTISYGQSQKWLNMTLKYLITLTIVCADLDDIMTNHKWFHVPIDGYILKGLNIKPIKAWSKIDKDAYLGYQGEFKRSYEQGVPILEEFQIWNNYNNTIGELAL
jgi:hypothetical protein